MPIHDELAAGAIHAAPAPARPESHAVDVARTVADPGAASHDAVFELQRLAGNSVVSRLLSPSVQRAASDEEAAAGRSPVLDVVGQGGGRPLDVGIRREMESALGADFSGVRLHTDSSASESARAVNANAYTVGNDVVVRNDRWAPDSAEGKKTIAHELTHVVQQRTGPVAGSDAGGGIRLSDPSDEFEQAADRTAAAVVAGGVGAPGPSAATGAGPAQLEADEAATAQDEFVQREGETAEEEEEIEDESVTQGEFVQRVSDEEAEEEEVVGGA